MNKVALPALLVVLAPLASALAAPAVAGSAPVAAQDGKPQPRPVKPSKKQRSGAQQGEKSGKPKTRNEAGSGKQKPVKARPAPQGSQRDSQQGQKQASQRAGQAQPGRGAAAQATPIDRTLATLERKVSSGQASSADFKALGRELTTFTSSEGARGQVANRRMQRTLADLERRSRSATLTPTDMALLREQWVDTRLDRALDELARTAVSRNLTREDFNKISALFERRAAAAKGIDPGAAGARRRLQGEVKRLQQVSDTKRLTAADLAPLRGELSESRLSRALTDLERRSLERKASEADVARVNDQIDDQPEGPKTDPRLYEKLRQAIARLEGRALRGEVTPEEFAELRASLTRRARNAAR